MFSLQLAARKSPQDFYPPQWLLVKFLLRYAELPEETRDFLHGVKLQGHLDWKQMTVLEVIAIKVMARPTRQRKERPRLLTGRHAQKR
jgi:hypothetical protein